MKRLSIAKQTTLYMFCMWNDWNVAQIYFCLITWNRENLIFQNNKPKHRFIRWNCVCDYINRMNVLFYDNFFCSSGDVSYLSAISFIRI